jgi:type II secretory pathway pseudopilin PulG
MKQSKGISLIALIITIIVIIILAAIVIGVALNTPESANRARFASNMSEIQHAVKVKLADNYNQFITNPDTVNLNNGFTRVTVNGAPENFDGFALEGSETGTIGYLVKLDTIKMENLTIGQEYKTATEVTFGITDAFIYDIEGEVFYAKGHKYQDVVYYSVADLEEGSAEIEAPNQKPTAVISMTPESNITTITSITWGYNNSTDPDSDAIVDAEWTGMQEKYQTPGTYTVSLRVKDSEGNWSDTVEKTFSVTKDYLALPEPEAGWIRYDDSFAGLVYSGAGWYDYSNPSVYYNGAIKLTHTSGENLSFRFNGTKLRIIGVADATYANANDISISIDGNVYNYTQYYATGIPKAVCFEIADLASTEHNVLIKLNGQKVGIDAIDVESTGYIYNSMSTRLDAPETGWQRFDETNTNLTYSTGWSDFSNTANYGGVMKLAYATGNNVTFKFYGTKLRIMSWMDTTFANAKNIKITMDGVDTYYTGYKNASPNSQNICFEKVGLPQGLHTVTITLTTATKIGIDSIDIDSSGYLSK